MRYILPALLLACTSSNLKRPDIIVVDTGNSVVDTDEPSSERGALWANGRYRRVCTLP